MASSAIIFSVILRFAMVRCVEDHDFVSLLQSRVTQKEEDPGGIEANEGLDDDELEKELDDENKDVQECEDWCYSKKHEDKEWEGFKCNWFSCSTCPECVPPTTAPTPVPSPNPTPKPTQNPTPAPTIPGLMSGDLVHIQNSYDGGSSWLDSCSEVSCAGSTAYGVSTSSSANRLGWRAKGQSQNTGLWQINRVAGGGIIGSGDTVYVVNQFHGVPTWLDVCGAASCTSGTQWSVVTNHGGSRGSTSQWKIEGNIGAAGRPIQLGETVTFKNLYTGGNGYLDSCGTNSCAESSKWNVHTNTGFRGKSSQWVLHAGEDNS